MAMEGESFALLASDTTTDELIEQFFEEARKAKPLTDAELVEAVAALGRVSAFLNKVAGR